MTIGIGVKEAFSRWTARLGSADELRRLGPEERKAIARDVAVPDDVLVKLVTHGNEAPLPLWRMLRVFGLRADQIRREHPGVMRELEVTCAGCGDGGRCRQDLARGETAKTFAAYCPNAPSFDALNPPPARIETRATSAAR